DSVSRKHSLAWETLMDVMVPQGTMTQHPRVVTVSALDRNGEPAIGAELTLFAGGAEFGTVTLGTAPARIQLPPSAGGLAVVARYFDETLRHQVEAYENYYEFR